MPESRPTDFFKPSTQYRSRAEARALLDVCKECPFYMKGIHVCKQCGCFMPAKTRLAHSECPIGKW